MKTETKLSNNEKAANRVAKAIAAGKVLLSHSPTAKQNITVGSYRQAVDTGIRFATLGENSRYNNKEVEERLFKTAEEAAYRFVSLVGSTRAREVAIKHGF